MTDDVLRGRLEEMCTHILFRYNGKDCGIDPITPRHFYMWCGDDTYVANSIDDVMSQRFFTGKSLGEIADKITDVEL